jgi:hypothetical protein
MKLQKIAVVGLFVLSFAGISAGAAQAADVYPNGVIIDCVSGYEAVYNADNTSGTCEPIATTFEAPVPASGCDSTVTEGVSDLTCVVAYSSLPTDATDTSDDLVTDDSQIAESGVPILMSRDVKFKSSGMESEGSSNESNLLAAFGVLVAAAGAFGIGLSNQRAAKK